MTNDKYFQATPNGIKVHAVASAGGQSIKILDGRDNVVFDAAEIPAILKLLKAAAAWLEEVKPSIAPRTKQDRLLTAQFKSALKSAWQEQQVPK